MKQQTCCFSGHRIISANKRAEVQKHLEHEILNLISQGVQYFGAGGAFGFDTIAALTVLKLKRKFLHIKLIMVLPCKEQTKGWDDKDIKIYNQILTFADKVVYTSEQYYNGCMHKRNRHLVNNSGFCICYLKIKSGGTAYTVNYARKQGLSITNIGVESSTFY